MARWRLVAPHYLAVPGVQWEYKELDRTTGKQKTVRFDVPTLLNPEDPEDHNHKYGNGLGEIVVTDGKDSPNPLDIVFNGPPTPDMVPIDDAAKKITASFADKWKHPIESLSGSYADEMLKQLEKQMDKVREPAQSNQIEGMSDLLAAMTAMMKQNQDVIALLSAKSATPEDEELKVERRA